MRNPRASANPQQKSDSRQNNDQEARRLQEVGHSCEMVPGICPLPVTAGTYDLLLCGAFGRLTTTNHARVAFARELVRAVRPGGAALLTLGNRRCPIDLSRNTATHRDVDPARSGAAVARGRDGVDRRAGGASAAHPAADRLRKVDFFLRDQAYSIRKAADELEWVPRLDFRAGAAETWRAWQTAGRWSARPYQGDGARGFSRARPIMWGIIPAAGAGTRLQPLAFSKELLPVGSRFDGEVERPRAVSEYIVERMLVAGATKICFVISPGKLDILQ